ncbi:MAG TPA: hypothetical protein VNY52_02760 [Solirubrobacteraceae bacterium]|jgi:hypothetical protein|nr:hypothetical protein [Solirubrobacteraceae bacterium]
MSPRAAGRTGHAIALLRYGAWLGLALLGLAMPSPAGADVFGPISLVSASPFQQVEYAHDAAISGAGRYVVFDGSIGGVTGVWRREIRPGDELVQVAGGDSELPSISHDGRYVSFTTNEGGKLAEITDGQPDVSRTEETPNVYVRNMSKQPGEVGAFMLASDLSYEYSAGPNQASEEKEYGAQAAGRTALSADGQKVVFVTTATSNLDGPGTPPLQVGIHDLETSKTEIVSVAKDPATGGPAIDEATGLPEPVPVEPQNPKVGAVYTRGGSGPPVFQAPQPHAIPGGVGASISADGSTVAWMGQEIGEQALTLPGETLGGNYSEPLWRRIADGERAPTRRVTGGSDPTNPQCAATHGGSPPPTPAPSDPCQGPFATVGGGIWNGAAPDYVVPQLSADGYAVAFIASAPLVSQGSDFGSGAETRPSDLYVADMHEGLSRVHALRQVTELAGGDETRIATDARILDFGISSDGTQVAFTTKRTVFPLGSLAYVSPPAAVPGLAELFDADLADATLTRVTQGYAGGAGEHPHEERAQEDPYENEDDGALSPSFSDGGETLAFSSTASNLVYGDGNAPPLRSVFLDGSDAFLVKRIQFGSTPTPQYLSSAPSLSVTPVWSLGVTARSLGNGDVLLYVDAPSAGTVDAYARSSVRTRSAGASRAAQGRRHAGSRVARGEPHASSRAARGRPARAGVSVLTRTVATAIAHIVGEEGGVTTLLLKLAPSYQGLAAQRGGLSATANLIFTTRGRSPLRQRIAVSFLRVASHSQKAAVNRKPKGQKGR